MAAIDDLIPGLQLSDDEKRQARAMGLLQLASVFWGHVARWRGASGSAGGNT